jgi:hypothetical protein
MAGFVEDPHQAVQDAHQFITELVDQVLDSLREEQARLERGWDSDGASTEELRLALREYRAFFDRLQGLSL